MSYTSLRITRLETRRNVLDTAVAAFSDGLEEYQIGQVRYRRANLPAIESELDKLEAQLSRLYALQSGGSRTYSRRAAW